MVDVDVLNVRLPEEIIEWCNEIVSKKIYRTKSEMIREILREYVLGERHGKQK